MLEAHTQLCLKILPIRTSVFNFSMKGFAPEGCVTFFILQLYKHLSSKSCHDLKSLW